MAQCDLLSFLATLAFLFWVFSASAHKISSWSGAYVIVRCHAWMIAVTLVPVLLLLWVSMIPLIRAFRLLHCVGPTLCILLLVSPVTIILLLHRCVALFCIVIPVLWWHPGGTLLIILRVLFEIIGLLHQ